MAQGGKVKPRHTALPNLLMMTAKSMLSKRPVLKFTLALFFLLHLVKLFLLNINLCATCYTLQVTPRVS